MDEQTARWLDAFTHRRRAAMPNLDTLETCPPDALDVARIVWHRRVVNETRSVELARQMQTIAARLGSFAQGFVAALQRLEEDETSHVELATAVLEKLHPPAITIPAETTEFVFSSESPAVSMMRLVLTGLCICESISASRFSSVRQHTDLDVYRGCIELFYRDELTHAELGFVMLPHVLQVLQDEVGQTRADEIVGCEMRATFEHMDRIVGLNLERQGGPPPTRPQPTRNPGVVEPAVDAAAFYRSIHEDIIPRLETLGTAARDAWTNRGRP